MASGWGHALASGVNGYMRGQQIVTDRESAEEEKAYRSERRARERKEWDEADSLKNDLRTAGTPMAMLEGAGGAVRPPTMDNRDVGQPGEVAMAANQGAFRVGEQTFADRGGAEAALAVQNAPQAIASRQGEVYARRGMPAEAAAMQDRALKMQKTAADLKANGVMESMSAFRMRGDSKSALAALKGAGFDVDGDVSVTPLTLDLPGIGKVNTYEASFNLKDGDKSTPMKVNAHQAAMAMMPYEKVLEQQRQASETGRTQGNLDRNFAEGVRQFDTTNGRLMAAAGQDSQLRGFQIERAELDLNDVRSNAKIPAAVKMKIEGLRKEADTIGAAIVKAQADGSWSPDAPSAKQLMERRAVITEQLNQSLTPYMPEAKGGSDPFSLRGKAPNSFQDPAWDGAEVAAAKKTGVPVEVLRTIRTVGERSNGDQVSPKGAQGVYQFIPSSREAFKKKYGVDAYSKDPNEQAMAAAYHLKESFDRTGSWDKAMAGYNGGTSGERGTNGTSENRAYTQRTSAALAASQGAQADPMDAMYRKQVNEMNKGLRVDLSGDVRDWLARRSDEKKQRFTAAQATYLQQEKDKAQRESKALAAVSRN